MTQLTITLKIERNWFFKLLEKAGLLQESIITININKGDRTIKMSATNVSFLGNAMINMTGGPPMSEIDFLKAELALAEKEQRFEDAAKIRDKMRAKK